MKLLHTAKSELHEFYGQVLYTRGKETSTSGTFIANKSYSVSLLIPRLIGAYQVILTVSGLTDGRAITKEMIWSEIVDTQDKYTVKIKPHELNIGIYRATFEIHCLYGKIYGYKDGETVIFRQYKSDFEPAHQITVSSFKYDAPEKLYGGIIYHVFVDRFFGAKKHACKEGSFYVKDWCDDIPEFPLYPGAPLKNNYFYGGDLDGITEKLDYLVSLGVSIIYLSPIFDSPSNHKYDTANYMKVDEMFGSDEALENLIACAKKKGIEIILDGVFNHTGADSIYFNKFSKYNSLGAYQSKSSPYYSWYDFKSHPNEYTSWWGIDILPRIHPDKKECGEYFVGNGGVIEKYAKMGILGFRLDVVDELSDRFIESIKQRLNLHNPSSILLGEVWEDASNKVAYEKVKRYYLGSELDGVMNYPIREGLVDYFVNKNTHKLKYALTDIIENAPERIRHAQMNLLGSHDTVRVLTALGGESSDGISNAILRDKRLDKKTYHLAQKKLASAYTVLATIPGIPSIYYGDEVGIEGYSDPFNRRTYPWGRENQYLLEHYKKIGKIRRDNTIYKRGDFKLLKLDSDLLIYERKDKIFSYITAVNNSDSSIVIEFEKTTEELIGKTKSLSYNLSENSSAIFKTRNNTSLKIIKQCK